MNLIIIMALFSATSLMAQERTAAKADNSSKTTEMRTYVIEREIPNAGELTADQLRDISKKSNEVLEQMGPGIEWLRSYVTDNKVYCVYKAQNKEAIKAHAQKAGFPANSIRELSAEISPSTADN